MPEHEKEGAAYKKVNGAVMGRLASVCWHANLDHGKRHEEYVLAKLYSGREAAYPPSMTTMAQSRCRGRATFPATTTA